MIKKARKRKILIAVAVTVLLFAAYFVYSSPMTLSQLYPMLTLDKCTEIRGYYKVGMQAEQTEFTIEHGSEEFQKLCTLFYEQKYRRSLRDIFPRGTRYHSTEPDDFQWDVHFCFENIEFPDGSSGSGPMLQFQNWYGELDIYFNGETHFFHTSEQEAWAIDVLDIIQ